MKKSFFKDIEWENMRNKNISPDDVPYKPNPNKYRYLLQNEYEQVSNLTRPGNITSPDQVTEPDSASSPKKRLLGDFTIYKVNREFENFW